MEFVWDMTVSREEFQRSLPAAVAGASFRTSGNVISSEASSPGWRIELKPLEDLRIGLLALPRHRVTVHLNGYTPEQAEGFLRRFELYFRRGGG